MGAITGINWCDSTWNVGVGCTKVDSDCDFCYMYRQSLSGTRYNPEQVSRTTTVFNAPLKWKDPRKIFCSSLTDLFHEAIDGYRYEVFDIMRRCPHHTFQVLTKRPERWYDAVRLAIEQAYAAGNTELAIWLKDWADGFPPVNIWLGTSVGSQDSIHRIEKLVELPAAVRFVSFEPLHGAVDLMEPWSIWHLKNSVRQLRFDWAIIGGESGNENGEYRYRPCQLRWIESLMNQLETGGVSVWVKQLGTHLAKEMKLKNRHGEDIAEWPEHLKIRNFPWSN